MVTIRRSIRVIAFGNDCIKHIPYIYRYSSPNADIADSCKCVCSVGIELLLCSIVGTIHLIYIGVSLTLRHKATTHTKCFASQEANALGSLPFMRLAKPG